MVEMDTLRRERFLALRGVRCLHRLSSRISPHPDRAVLFPRLLAFLGGFVIGHVFPRTEAVAASGNLLRGLGAESGGLPSLRAAHSRAGRLFELIHGMNQEEPGGTREEHDLCSKLVSQMSAAILRGDDILDVLCHDGLVATRDIEAAIVRITPMESELVRQYQTELEELERAL